MNRQILLSALTRISDRVTLYSPVPSVADFVRAASIELEKSYLAQDTRPGDYCKIIRCDSGEQVLFRKGETHEGLPCLYQMVEYLGASVEINLSFKPEQWETLDKAFEKSDKKAAEAILSQAKLGIEGQ